MKILKIAALVFVISTVFYACEKLDAPYKIGVGDSERGSSGDTVKNVLIEDYTGHGCPNCPAAADIAHDLQGVYGERVVIVGVHAGFFATPDIFGQEFDADYTTQAGNTWDTYFGISQVGNPNGMIDRVELSPGDYVVTPTNWGAKVSDQLTKDFLAKITITNDFNAGTRKLGTTVQAEFQTSLIGNYALIACITQDSIISAQKDNRVGGEGVVEDYHHMHVLRGSMNGDWGENITGGEDPIGGKTYEKSYSITFEDDWVADDCWVVAFVYDESNKTLIQVDEEKVTK